MMKKYFLVFVSSVLYSTAPNTVVGTVQDLSPATFYQPFPVAITPDGTSLYVGNFAGGPPLASVSIIDVATNRVTGTVNDPQGTFIGPNAFAITPNGATVYVVNDTDTVSYVDIATNTAALVNDPGMTFNNPYDVAVVPGGIKAYVLNSSGNSISIIDVAHNIVSSPTITSTSLSAPISIAITPDGSKAYVGNFISNAVAIVDVANDVVTGTLATNGFPFGRPESIAITPDGTTAYVANYLLSNINIVNVATNTVTGTVSDPLALFNGNGLQVCAITPNGKTLYVTTDANTVIVVDIATNTAIGLVSDAEATFNGLFGMAITPDGSTGYVTDFNTRSVSIIAIAPAPLVVTGCKSQNVFLLQKSLINKLTWSAPSNGTTPVAYRIYRDAELADLVATVPASGSQEYLDYNRHTNVVYGYYIVSVDEEGTLSVPSSVVVNQPC